MKEIIIIGGGASGLFASIILKQKLNNLANVTILERLEKVGKKILATGNGRCNLTNENLNERFYNYPLFVKNAFKEFGYPETIKFFENIGLLTKTLNEGRVYPYSELATSVLDTLRNEAKRLGVVEKCNNEVKKITPMNNSFIIETTRNIKINADYIIMACGGKCDAILGSNGSGYQILKSLKIEVTDLYPGLVGVLVDPNSLKGLDGIRVKGLVQLLTKKRKELLFKESGEIIFKQDGLSGIVIMQLSTFIARSKLENKLSSTVLSIDLIPNYTKEVFHDLLMKRKDKLGEFSLDNLFTGIFHRLISLQIIKRSKMDHSMLIKNLQARDITKLVDNAKNLEFDIIGTYPFDKAQVTVGGVMVNELNGITMELNKIPNLFVSGEIINIDGECGGFNLQWAWTSGYLAANTLTQKILNEEARVKVQKNKIDLIKNEESDIDVNKTITNLPKKSNKKR